MKVFDFTNGKRGELLGEVKRIAFAGGALVRKGNKVFRIDVAKKEKGSLWTWHECAGFRSSGEDVRITPEEFGVSAICFCSGQFVPGNEWHWHVLGTADWNRKAVSCGILSFEVIRVVDENEEQAAEAA